MDHDEFIGRVQHRAQLSSRGEAEAAVRATLTTLGERLAGDAPHNLSAQLPHEIGRLVENHQQLETYDLDDFFDTVAEREGTELPESVHHARAVLDVLQEAVSPGQIEKILEQLPEDYDQLFAAGSLGELEIND